MDKHARKIKAVKGKHYRWKVPFYTNGKMIHCESSIERDYVRTVDFASNIIDVIYQPLVINYMYKGKHCKYYPDFKLITKKGDTWLVEVKSEQQLNKEKNIPKYICGKMYCESQGWQYRIVTEKEIRVGYLQDNLSLLRAYGSQTISAEVLEIVYEKLLKRGTCTISDLKTFCLDMDDSQFYAAVYSLIQNHRVFGDLIKFKIGIHFEISV